MTQFAGSLYLLRKKQAQYAALRCRETFGGVTDDVLKSANFHQAEIAYAPQPLQTTPKEQIYP